MVVGAVPPASAPLVSIAIRVTGVTRSLPAPMRTPVARPSAGEAARVPARKPANDLRPRSPAQRAGQAAGAVGPTS